MSTNKLDIKDELFYPIFNKIDELVNIKENIIIAIDGGSASGKTTLSDILAKRYEVTVFHMDDFFLQKHQRTKERLAEVGGNIDRERFIKEILLPISKKEIINYHKFDCSTFTLSETFTIEPMNIIIIEGVYSFHPEFVNFYDLKIFLDISSKYQQVRVINRNSEYIANRYFNEWIPLENKYFNTFKIKEKADILIKISK